MEADDRFAHVLALQHVLAETLARLASIGGGDGIENLTEASKLSAERLERIFANPGEQGGSTYLHETMQRTLHHLESIWDTAVAVLRDDEEQI